MGTLASGSIDLKSLRIAGEGASKYIVADSTGIMVYDGSNGSQTPSTIPTGISNVFIDDSSVNVRTGTTPRATFGADGAIIGLDGTYQTRIYAGGFTVSDGTGFNAFSMEPTDVAISRGYSKSIKLGETYGTDTVKIDIPISQCSVTFSVNNGTSTTSETYTNSSFAIGTRKTIWSIEITRVSTNTFIIYTANYHESNIVTIKYTMPATAATAKLTFSGANMPLFTSTGNWMRDTDAINLSEPISMQLNGIVIAWSEYVNGATQDYGWKYTYIPKNSVLLNENMGVICGPFATTGFGYVGNKYLYITDSRITGHASNIATGTASSGIKYDNSHWVLRYVWGV